MRIWIWIRQSHGIKRFSTFSQMNHLKNYQNDQNLPFYWYNIIMQHWHCCIIFCVLHFIVIKSKFVVKLLMQCNESESKVARFVLNLISKSLMIVQSWNKLHLMIVSGKQKSSPDPRSATHHLTKSVYLLLPTLYLIYYGGLYFVIE